ncbi:MAG: hypothetical protein H7146_04135 [Burkholderiaceae bacterium]|nr:hypothetical protein [Microbacteriaceae bacterium]
MAPTRTLTAATLTVVAVLLLSACSAAPAPAPTTPPTVEAPSPSPTATPVEETDDALFTISAKVRATDGTTMDISLVGHTPIPVTSSGASRLASTFVEKCSAMGGYSMSNAALPVSMDTLVNYGSSLMRIDYSTTPDDHTIYSPVDLELGSPYFSEVVTGDGFVAVTTNRTCTGGYQLTKSGSGMAILNFESGSPAPDLAQWRYGHYGFSVPFASGASIEACSVEVSDLAQETVAEVPGWEPGSDATGISCGTGYRGE